jgi:hypothetical protein
LTPGIDRHSLYLPLDETRLPEGRPAGRRQGNRKRIKPRWYWACHPDRALSKRSYHWGWLERDTRSLEIDAKCLRAQASIKKNGRRRSVTGAGRQSEAEPDEVGKAFGGSAVHHKRSSNTSTRRGGASLLSFFCASEKHPQRTESFDTAWVNPGFGANFHPIRTTMTPAWRG